MTRYAFIQSVSLVVSCVLVAALLAWPAAIQADQAQYFYDALGRLSAVVDGQGNVAFYNYDAVGNLISITRTGPAAAPAITAVSPATIDAGTSANVTITGTGFQFPSVKTSNPDIQISNVVTTTSSITATFAIANPTAFGLVTVTVKTLGGTASTSLTVRQATPNITQLTPDGGVVGTTVVIAGTGFGTKAGSNHVTFAGLGGVRLAATVLTENNTSIKTTAPPGVAAGPVTVEVGGLTSNEVLFKALTLTAVASTATQGTAANPGLPSANMGQLITVQGVGLSGQVRLVVPTVADAGTPGTILLPLTNVSADGATAQAQLPASLFTFTGGSVGSGSVVTGPVTIRLVSGISGAGSVTLQIVPVMFNTLRCPGTAFTCGTTPGSVVSMLGTGFEPNNTQVRFPGIATPVPANRAYTYPPDASKMALDVTIPSGIGPGPITITTNGGTSNASLVNVGIRAINAVAAQGVPLNTAVASANAGQTIQLQGAGLSTSTLVQFSNGSANAVPSTVNPDGTVANIVVPSAATTGLVTHPFSIFPITGVPLQIVPTIFSFTLPPGATLTPGVVATITGSGFKDGVTTVTFPGAAPVSATVVSSGGLTVTVPADIAIPPSGTSGPLTVTTDGGTSNALRLSNPVVTGIVATAARGTAAAGAQPSANVGQSITLSGSGFTSFTQVVFPTFDPAGTVGSVALSPNSVSLDGTSLTVNVPVSVLSGPVSVRDFSTGLGGGSVALQIVSTVDSATGDVTAGTTLTLQGSGFEPNATKVQFPGVASPVTADPASIQKSAGTQASVTVPPGVDPTGQLTAVTPGGVSNPFNLSTLLSTEIEPNNTPATATPFAFVDIGVTATKSATINPAGDVDYYKVFVNGGFFNKVTVTNAAGPSGPAMTIRLTWLGQDGVTVVASVQSLLNPGNSLQIPVRPFVSGTYFFRVEEITGQGGPNFKYTISFTNGGGI